MKLAYLEILEKCNLNCEFCSLGQRKQKESSFEDIKIAIDNYASLGFLKLIITGGEPFLHPKLEEILDYAILKGFREISIQTNGTLLNEEKIKMIADKKIVQIVFSIHSHIASVEDELMGGRNVLSRQLKGLELANKKNISTPVTIVINSLNYKTLPDFFEFMILKYPFVNHYSLNFVDPVGTARENKKIVPKYSQIEINLLKSAFKLKKANKTFRIERVPLCYMFEFAEYSTEMRRITTKEYNASNRDKVDKLNFDEKYFSEDYVKGNACKSCFLKSICPGINRRYSEIYGFSELYPIFVSPDSITSKAGAD